jgi:hypothetical protein
LEKYRRVEIGGSAIAGDRVQTIDGDPLFLTAGPHGRSRFGMVHGADMVWMRTCEMDSFVPGKENGADGDIEVVEMEIEMEMG